MPRPVRTFDDRLPGIVFLMPARTDTVAVSRLDAYGDERARAAISRVADLLGWSSGSLGPFGKLIPAGAKVLVKPNWVMHANAGPGGIEPLVTHGSIIKAVVDAALQAPLSALVVGDAPLQQCDFKHLLAEADMRDWVTTLMRSDPRFRGVFDFRRTKSVVAAGIRHAKEEQADLQDFVLFDLGSESLLEGVSGSAARFRVTQYDPRHMARTHGQGVHRYLVARAVVDADVVINLPKLKTHQKAGLTCALKNLIGINGNKEFLPHHRLGGAQSGGDCYPGRSRIKRTLEFVLDRQNCARSTAEVRFWHALTRYLHFALHLQKDELGVEGSWSGNDTIWRTCLDLNRILLYGRADGTLADTPQRRILHLADAVVAGQGNGPLAPEPLGLGLVLGSASAAAMDWVAARLLGYDADLLPTVRHAFDPFRWPLTRFSGNDITVTGDLGVGVASDVLDTLDPPTIRYPAGWRGAADMRVRPPVTA